MTREEIVSEVLLGLEELQKASGLDVPTLSAATNPFDLQDFDSLKCVELEVILTRRLGAKVQDVLIVANRPQVNLTVSGIADRILELGIEAAQGTPDA